MAPQLQRQGRKNTQSAPQQRTTSRVDKRQQPATKKQPPVASPKARSVRRRRRRVNNSVATSPKNKPTPSKKNKLPSNAVVTITGQFLAAAKEKCVAPVPIVFSSASVLTQILSNIDEVIMVYMKLKPTYFQYQDNQEPVLKINVLRGLYMNAFFRYAYNVGSLNNSTLAVPQSSYDNLAIPMSLAKIFQQYAPYVDPLTGASYRWDFPYVQYTINTGYFSIDSNSTGGTNLNAPLYRYLIHPARVGAFTTLDYCTLGNKSLITYTSNSTNWVTYYSSTIDQAIVTTYNMLPNSKILLGDIPKTAPDASSYTTVDYRGVSCPVSNFRADVACILYGNAAANTGLDFVCNWPYDAPIPVVKIPGAATTFNAARNNMVLRQVFHTVLADTKEWDAGSAINLVATSSTPGLDEFSYRGVAVDGFLLATRFSSVYREAGWEVDDANKAFSLSLMFWSAFYHRLTKFGTLNCTGDINTEMSFFCTNANASSNNMPAVLSKVLASLGHSVVGGKLYVTQLGSPPLNSPTQTSAHTWYSALSTAGIWNPGAVPYGVQDTATSVSPITIYQLNNNTPLSRVDPAGVVYNYIPVALLATYSSLLTSMPSRLQIDSGSTPPSILFGTKAGVMCSLTYSNVSSVANYYQDKIGVKIGQYIVPTAVQGNICISSRDVEDAILYSSIASSGGNGGTVKSMLYIIEQTASDITNSLQRNLSPSTDSQFTNMSRANLYTRELSRRKGNDQDTTFATTSRILRSYANGIMPDIVTEGSGNRDNARHYMLQMSEHGSKGWLDKITTFFQSDLGNMVVQSLYDVLYEKAFPSVPRSLPLLVPQPRNRLT